jgi:hypothetical protein
MFKTIVFVNDEGEEVTVEVPAYYEICSRCNGKGSHVNPAIDGHGISMEEWNGPDWDDESREMYMNGGYDIACEAGCDHGKQLVPDLDRINPEIVKAYHQHLDNQAAWDAEQAAERAMGA